MKTRAARTQDAEAICGLINYYAERGKMLHRSMQSIYDSLRNFHVAQINDGIVGCVASEVFWFDLAEIKSLAVAPQHTGKGIGSMLVRTAIEDLVHLGVGRIFTLTYERRFFEKLGFSVIDRNSLPEKVWRECITCPKLDHCDEIAMMLSPKGGEQSNENNRE